MREDDRDLVALFAAEEDARPDPAFVARVADDVARQGRRRVALMSAGGLALGLSGAATLALFAPLFGEAGRVAGEALQGPQMSWIVLVAGLALAVGVPLWRAR